MDSLNFNSVETLPDYEARAAFLCKGKALGDYPLNFATVFATSGRGCFAVYEDVDIVPIIIDDKLSYVPWGGDNQMPFNIIDLIEKDDTLATCSLIVKIGLFT